MGAHVLPPPRGGHPTSQLSPKARETSPLLFRSPVCLAFHNLALTLLGRNQNPFLAHSHTREALQSLRQSTVLDAMSALRLHKGAVPGGEKATGRQTRRSLQLSRQRASRGSLLQSLRTFLTADSFMYGPLLESPPPPPPSPPVHISSDDSEPHTPEREQEDGGLEDGNNKAANGKEGTVTIEGNGKNGNGHGHEETTTPRRVQGSSKTILSYQRTTRTGRTLKLPAGNGTPTSTAPVMRDHEPLNSP